MVLVQGNTVESRYNGPISSGNPPITEVILMSLEKFLFIICIGKKRNPPRTDNKAVYTTALVAWGGQ